MIKKRLDILLSERGLTPSRERAKTTIMSGLVYVNGQKAEKSGQEFPEDVEIEVRKDPIGFVSRGGLKLEKALTEFDISVDGLNILDCGASTGGFTDCMLGLGAKHVWAIDVGYGQLAWSLRNDARVTCMERTNVRHLTCEKIGLLADFAVMDLSFISLKLVLPVVKQLINTDSEIVCLIKPQFEAGKGQVGKNGVVREADVHLQVLQSVLEFAKSIDLYAKGLTFSPIKGPKGNIEFLAYFSKKARNSEIDCNKVVNNAHDAWRETE